MEGARETINPLPALLLAIKARRDPLRNRTMYGFAIDSQERDDIVDKVGCRPNGGEPVRPPRPSGKDL